MVTRIRQDICILCFTGNKNIQSILSTDYDNILVEEKLKYIFPEFINVKPAHICSDCLKELNYVYKFKQKCSHNLISYMNDIIPENRECNNIILTATNTQCESTLQNHKSANAPESNAKVKYEIQENTSEDNFTIKLEQDFDEDTDVQCQTMLFDDMNSESIVKYEFEDDDSGTFVNVKDEIDVKFDPLLPETLVDKLQSETINNTDHIPPSTASGGKKLLYKCCKCRQIITQKQDITTHKCSDTKPTETFDCEVCDTSFTTQDLLKTHLRSHKSRETYTCSYCLKICNRRDNFIAHKRLHTGYKAHKCNLCDKAFTQKCHLFSHTRFHEKATPFVCLICEKAFDNALELMRHNRMHPEEENCRCEICGAYFRSINQLQLHKYVHYDGKFKCDVCDKISHNEINYLKHKMIHSREKPFKCDKCNAAVSTSHRLTIHKKMHYKKNNNDAVST